MVAGGELAASELIALVAKVEAAAAKSLDSEADKQRAIDGLERIGRDLRSKKVLALAQEQAKAGKRLKKLEKHKCMAIASTAQRILTAVIAKFKNQEAVARGVAKFKAAQAEKAKDQSLPRKTIVEQKKELPPASAKPSVAAATPASPAGAPQSAYDKARSVVKKALLEGLKIACEETDKALDVAEAKAAELEDELDKKFNKNRSVTKEYKLKYRSLSFNLKDKNNPDLRRRLLCGEIRCKDIILWTPQQLASDKRKEDNAVIKKNMLLNAQARAPTVSSTDQFKCGKCKQRKCTYYQMQTRSADEPMTTFVTCTNCNNRWKFS